MASETSQYCSRCGRPFREGQTRYIVTVHIVADFDGRLEDKGSPLPPDRMWRQIEEKSEQELINEVVQKLFFVLCKPCRDAWLQSPFGSGDRNDLSSASSVH